MGKVFREITITWQGDDYTFTPSNRFLRRVDAGLSPQTLMGVLSVMDGRNVPLPAMSYIIAEMVKEGGGNADENSVYAALTQDVQENAGKGIAPLVGSILEAITPPDAASKN